MVVIRKVLHYGHFWAKTKMLRSFGYYIYALETNLVRINKERRALKKRLYAALTRLEELEGAEAPIGTELTLENLYALIRRNNTVTKTDLQDYFNSTYPTVQSRLDRLEEEGYIEYVASNRRFKVLREYP